MAELHELSHQEQGGAPSTPSSTRRKIYAKSDGWYELDDTGLETKIGGLGGGTGAVDNAVLRADGTGGGALQNSGVIIDDSDNVSTPGDITIGLGTTAELVLGLQVDQNTSTGINEREWVSPYLEYLNATQVTLYAGSGIISNPASPGYYKVSWVETIVTITGVAVDGFTVIYIDNTGAILQQNTIATATEYVNTLVLGGVAHSSGALIATTVKPVPEISANASNRVAQLLRALGTINNGVIITPNGANLTIDKSAGSLHIASTGWEFNEATPDSDPISIETPMVFEQLTQTDVLTGSTTTILDVANYDVAGVITPIGGGGSRATNHRVFLAADLTPIVQYGQVEYTSLALAQVGAVTESFTKAPQVAAFNAFLIGIISVISSATDLSNPAQALFQTDFLLSGSSGGGGGGGGGGAPTAATYITQTPDTGLSNEQALSTLSTGVMKNTTVTGVISIAVDGTDYVSPAGTATLTNKTYDAEAAGNVITNIGSSEVNADLIDGLTTENTINAATDEIMFLDATVGQLRKTVINNLPSAGGSGLYVSIAMLSDTKATTVNGGSASAATWNARDLNTEDSDADNIVTIASDEFTPISGTYKIFAYAPAFDVDEHRLRLYNVTGVASVKEGSDSFAPGANNGANHALLTWVFTANGTDAYRIDHYTALAKATNGLGVDTADGSSEIYLRIVLEKLS